MIKLCRAGVIRLGLGAVVPLLMVLLWIILRRVGYGFALPAISDVLGILLSPFGTPQTLDVPPLWFSAVVSLLRTVIGFVLAVIIAVPLGMLIGRSRILRLLLQPVLGFFYVISPLAWLPVLIALAGIDSLAALIFGGGQAWEYPVLDNLLPAVILIVAMAAFFPVFLTTERAVMGVRDDLVEAATLMGAGRRRLLLRVIFPYCLPEILGGMRVGLGRSWMVIVAAEMYPGTRSGLGYTIWVSHLSLEYDYTFAAIIMIGILGLLMNFMLRLLEGRVGHWEARRI